MKSTDQDQLQPHGPNLSEEQRTEFIKGKLAEYGKVANIGTFAILRCFWRLSSIYDARYGGEYTRTAGHFFNLGAGDWMFVGDCFGTWYSPGGQNSVSNPCSLEFKAAARSLTWAIGDTTQHYPGPITETSGGLQYRADAAGQPKVLLVTSNITFGLLKIHPNSYTTFEGPF